MPSQVPSALSLFHISSSSIEPKNLTNICRSIVTGISSQFFEWFMRKQVGKYVRSANLCQSTPKQTFIHQHPRRMSSSQNTYKRSNYKEIGKYKRLNLQYLLPQKCNFSVYFFQILKLKYYFSLHFYLFFYVPILYQMIMIQIFNVRGSNSRSEAQQSVTQPLYQMCR